MRLTNRRAIEKLIEFLLVYGKFMTFSFARTNVYRIHLKERLER
jgi:hypothetical protein